MKIKNIKKDIVIVLILFVIVFSMKFSASYDNGKEITDWPELDLKLDLTNNLRYDAYECGMESIEERLARTGDISYYSNDNGAIQEVQREVYGVCEGEETLMGLMKTEYYPETIIPRIQIKDFKKCIGQSGYLDIMGNDLPTLRIGTLTVPEGAEEIYGSAEGTHSACGPPIKPNGYALAEIEWEDEEAPEEPPKPIHLVQTDSQGRKTYVSEVPRPYWAEPAGLTAIPTSDDDYTYSPEPITQEEYCEGLKEPVVVEEGKIKKILRIPGKFFTGVAKTAMKTVKGTANVFIPACEGSGRYENVLIQINPGDTSESILTRIKDKIIESLKPGCNIGEDASQVNEAWITINLDNIIDNSKDKLVGACAAATGTVTQCNASRTVILYINKCRNYCEVFQSGFKAGGGVMEIGVDCVGANILNLFAVKSDTAATAAFVGFGAAGSSSGGSSGGGGDTGGGGGDKILSSFPWTGSGTP